MVKRRKCVDAVVSRPDRQFDRRTRRVADRKNIGIYGFVARHIFTHSFQVIDETAFVHRPDMLFGIIARFESYKQAARQDFLQDRFYPDRRLYITPVVHMMNVVLIVDDQGYGHPSCVVDF